MYARARGSPMEAPAVGFHNTPLIKPFNQYNLFNIYSTSSLIALSQFFISLFLLILRTHIKRIGGNNLGQDSNRGFSYTISSQLVEKGQKPTVITLYITTFCLTSLIKSIYRYFQQWPSIVFHRHRNINAFQVKFTNKITLARVSIVC